MNAYDTLRTAAATVAADPATPPAALNLAGQILDAVAVLEVAENGFIQPTAGDPASDSEPAATESTTCTTPAFDPETGTPTAGPTEPTAAADAPASGATTADSASAAAPADADPTQPIGAPAAPDPMAVAPATVDHSPAPAPEAAVPGSAQ